MRVFGGLRPWVLQRLSALYLLACFVALALMLGFARPAGYAQWRAGIAHPLGTAAALAFFTALFLHTWIGLRDVLLDYVKPLWLRGVLFTAIAAALVAGEGWVLVALARLHGL